MPARRNSFLALAAGLGLVALALSACAAAITQAYDLGQAMSADDAMAYVLDDM